MNRAFVTALVLSICPLAAVEATDATSMRVSEQREVTSASASLLSGAMDFRSDGTVHAVHKIGRFSIPIQLKDLSLAEIVKLPVTKADQAKGITRRYHAKLACRAHRLWDRPLAKWSEWRESSYGFLPTTIVVEEVNGKIQASAHRITDFSPYKDGAMTAAAE